MPPSYPPLTWKERAWLVTSATVPALVATGRLDGYGSGGQDAAIVRTAGLGYAGGGRALDAWLAAPFALLPLGTRTLRAELPGIFLLAAVAGLAFLVTWRALVAASGPSGWASAVAAMATAGVSLSYPVQAEAVAPGSSLAGVVLVLITLVVAREAGRALRACLFVLALTYDVPIGLGVGVALVAATGSSGGGAVARTGPRLAGVPAVLLGAACGFVPLALAALRGHVAPLATNARPFAGLLGDGPAPGIHRASELTLGELGEPVLLLAVVGLAWGLWSRRARADVLPLAAVGAMAVTGFVSLAGGGPDGWSATGLLTMFLAAAFAAVAMQEAVLRVARARLPLASASAAMVVVLEAAFPAVQLDEALTRTAGRSHHALSVWEDAAFAGLQSGALVLVSSPPLYTRLLATRAAGELPGDLRVLPAFDPSNAASVHALAGDAQLVPLFRDLALTGVPQELSLSTLATKRPVVLATDPRWDRNLTRHLVPGGLLAVFEPEPRGGADRKRALADSQPWRTRLGTSLGAEMDTPLARLTASLLFDRAAAAAESGEREVALQARADAAVFAPNDPRIHELARRQVGGRGSVDVHDLTGQGRTGP